MGQAKPWQIVLFAVAAVALGVSAYFSFGRSDIDLASSLRMADVNTGEFFSLKIGKGGATIPGRNPKTGEMTLMPVHEKSGRWLIADRYFVSLKDIPGTHPAVDEKTREVRQVK